MQTKETSNNIEELTNTIDKTLNKAGHLVEIDAQASKILQALTQNYQERAATYLKNLDDPALNRLSVARLEEATNALILVARTDPTLKTTTLEVLEELYRQMTQLIASVADG